MARKHCFLVCPPLGNMAGKQRFLVFPPSRNIGKGTICFLVCPFLGNMARKQYSLFRFPAFAKHGEGTIYVSGFVYIPETWLGNIVSGFAHLWGTWLGNNVSWFVHLWETWHNKVIIIIFNLGMALNETAKISLLSSS